MNEERFSGKGNAYAKYRPGYPKEFLDFLYDEIGFTAESIIADVGSGTGIFTKQLLERGSSVFGVEPNADMRNIAENELLKFDKFTSINAGAENTALKDNSVDFVTAAQAFHWFNTDMFRVECKRILKPEGKVILVWNSRNEESIITKECEQICIRLCKGFNGFSGGISGPLKSNSISSFFNGNFKLKIFDYPMHFDKDSFIGRNLSSSYAPKESDGKYTDYIAELSDLFDKYAVNGLLEYPFYTQCYYGTI